MGKASQVKQYARILYSIDGEEHSAVALSVPNVAYHAGTRQGNCYINLLPARGRASRRGRRIQRLI